jgi:hypothetical protein
MSCAYITSVISIVKLVPYLSENRNINQIYFIEFVKQGDFSSDRKKNITLELIFEEFSKYFNVNFQILQPIIYTRSPENHIKIFSQPDIKICAGDYVSDSLIELYKNNIKCNFDDFFVFTHGISTLKYLLPGFYSNRNILKKFYAHIIKPTLVKIKIKLKLRANFKNLILFDGFKNEIQNYISNNHIPYNYNLIVINNQQSLKCINRSRELFMNKLINKNIMLSKYNIFCPIAEETKKLNLDFLRAIRKQNPNQLTIIKPHASDHNDYSSDDFMLDELCIAIERLIPLELFISRDLEKIYMPMCSAIIDIPHSKLRIIEPTQKYITELYNREYWPFHFLYGNEFLANFKHLKI